MRVLLSHPIPLYKGAIGGTMNTLKQAPRAALYIGNFSKKPVNKESIEAMKKEDDRMVKGVFKNLENPGQDAYIACKLYKGQPLFSKWFMDGEEAEIPLSVARHINQNTQYPVHGYLLDEKGNHVKGTGRMVQRYQFISREFM